MNAKLQQTVLFLAAGISIWPTFAYSFDFPYLFKDPLYSMPDVIQKGAILPGDSTPIPHGVQKDFTQPLTLYEAVDLALANNPKIKGAWADIKVQAGTLGEAYTTYLPSINGALNWTNDNIHYSNSRYHSTDTNRYNGQVTATLRLLDFGGRNANRRYAEKLLAAAISSYDATLQDALSEIVQAYFDAMTASASLTAKIKDEEVARNTLHSAQEREAKGVVSQSDTLRATTALARASLDKYRAQGEYQKSLAVLGRSLGLKSDIKFILPPELTEQQNTTLPINNLTIWLDEAQKAHPAIIAARKQLEAAQEQVTVTKSAGLPSIGLSGNYYKNTRPGEAVTPGTTETTVVVALSIPLFDGFSSTYKLRGAQARVEKQAAALFDKEQQVAMDIIKAYASAVSSLGNLGASVVLLESAQKALAVSQRKYDKGAADITEILSTQADLANAMNERVRCLAEWHASQLQLLASAGKMGRFAVKDP